MIYLFVSPRWNFTLPACHLAGRRGASTWVSRAAVAPPKSLVSSPIAVNNTPNQSNAFPSFICYFSGHLSCDLLYGLIFLLSSSERERFLCIYVTRCRVTRRCPWNIGTCDLRRYKFSHDWQKQLYRRRSCRRCCHAVTGISVTRVPGSLSLPVGFPRAFLPRVAISCCGQANCSFIAFPRPLSLERFYRTMDTFHMT